MISTHSRSSCSRNSRQGFSLIEVAIALVIFVIGALAIIRIFPGALSVIGNNGDQQIATNLNRTTLARLQSENAVPYSTFNVGLNADGSLKWTTGGITNHTDDFSDINASIIGVPRLNSTLPTPEDINTGANNSALSRFRGIQGERVDINAIPELVNGTPTNVSYVLTQFPLSLEKINNGAEDLLAPIISREYAIDNVRIDKSKKLDFSEATIAQGDKIFRLDDASNPKAMLAKIVPAKSIIYVSYRYYNAAGAIWSVKDEPVPMPNTQNTDLTATATNIIVSPPTTPTLARNAMINYVVGQPKTGTVAEIIDIRVKRFMGLGEFGPIGSPVPNGTGYPTIDQKGDARRGMIRYDEPAAFAPLSDEPLTVDYIADWSWLLQKGVPQLASSSTVGAKQLALSAPFIDEQSPVAMYSLLINNSDNTSFRSQFGSSYPAPNPTTGSLTISSDPNSQEDELRSGKATFSIANSADAIKARVAYRTRSLWVQQLSVAAANYKPYARRNIGLGNAPLTEPWRDFYLGDDNYLYFHASEAGKTINLSYTINDGTVERNLVDRPYAIESDIIQAGNLVPSVFFQGLQPGDTPLIARVRITDADGNALAPPSSPTTFPQLVSIQAIKGTSVTARTAYVNGTKYAQKLNTTTRGANS